MAMVLRSFLLSGVCFVMLVVEACVGGPGDPTGHGQGQSVDTRESSKQSDEPQPGSAEPRAADASTEGGGGSSGTTTE